MELRININLDNVAYEVCDEDGTPIEGRASVDEVCRNLRQIIKNMCRLDSLENGHAGGVFDENGNVTGTWEVME